MKKSLRNIAESRFRCIKLLRHPANAGLMYLPQLLTFKAFGVEATLIQQKLDRADELIARMKHLAAANAQATYGLLAWGNRWGGMPAAEKQRIADKIDEQLISFDFGLIGIQEIRGAYVPLIGIDLAGYFESALSEHLIAQSRSDGEKQSQMLSWVKDWNESKRISLVKLRELGGDALARFLIAEIPKDTISDATFEKFTTFATRIGKIYSDCLARGGYTPAASIFLEEFMPLAGDTLVAHVLQ